MSAAAKRRGGADSASMAETRQRTSAVPTGALDLAKQRRASIPESEKRDFLGRSRQERLEDLERSIEDLADGKAIPFEEGLARFKQAREGKNG